MECLLRPAAACAHEVEGLTRHVHTARLTSLPLWLPLSVLLVSGRSFKRCLTHAEAASEQIAARSTTTYGGGVWVVWAEGVRGQYVNKAILPFSAVPVLINLGDLLKET